VSLTLSGQETGEMKKLKGFFAPPASGPNELNFSPSRAHVSPLYMVRTHAQARALL